MRRTALIALSALLLLPALSLADEASRQKEFIEIRNTKCVLCHPASRFEKRDFTQEEWNAILDKMVNHGLDLDANQLDVLRHGSLKW